MIEKIISVWVCILEKNILKNVWLWKPFWFTLVHKNDSTRGLPYQNTVHQALQIMRIHVDRLMKNWPPHSVSFRNLYSILLLQTLLLNIQTCLAVLVWNWNMNWLDVISLMIIKIIQISEKCSSRFWCFLSFQVPVIFFVAELKIGRKSRKIHQI